MAHSRAGRAASTTAEDVAESVACFAAGTQVQTEEGEKSIQDIKAGDRVLSRDEQTGEVAYRKVVRTYVTPDQPVLELQLGDGGGQAESLVVTAEHPFWGKAQGWVAAVKLQPGDEVFTSRGGWVRVSGSTWLSGRQVVYNLEVDGFHTYFVGESGVWAHNNCAGRSATEGKNFEPKQVRDTSDQSRRAAMREAKRRSGVPTSQTHNTHRVVRDKTVPGKTVKEYDFEVPAVRGGCWFSR